MNLHLLYLMLAFCTTLHAAHFEGLVDLSIRVEDPSYQIVVAALNFNGKEIQLGPHDLFKPRAEIQMKLPPGRYPLNWAVQKGQGKWVQGGGPLNFEKILVLESGDATVRVIIKGENVTLY